MSMAADLLHREKCRERTGALPTRIAAESPDAICVSRGPNLDAPEQKIKAGAHRCVVFLGGPRVSSPLISVL